MSGCKLDDWLADRRKLAVLAPAGPVDVPPGVLALALCEGGRYVLHRPGQRLEAQAVTDVLWVRDEPWSLEFESGDLISQESYRLTAKARIVVRPIPREGELRSLRGQMLYGGGSVTSADLVKRFDRGVRIALREFTIDRPAAVLVDGGDAAALADLGREHLKAALFEVGVRVDEPLSAVFRCEAVARFRAARQDVHVAEQLRELRAAVEVAEHSGPPERERLLVDVFSRTKGLAAGADGLRIEDILAQFDERHRASLYAASLEGLGGATGPSQIVVAARGGLAWLDPRSRDAWEERLDLGSAVGGVRSVSNVQLAGRSMLLVGGGWGLHLVDPQARRCEGRLVCKHDGRPRGGFNAATVCAERVFGTHSELGLVAWDDLDSPGRPIIAELTSGAQAVRCVAADRHGRLLLAIDRRVLVLDVQNGPRVVAEAVCGDNLVTCMALGDDEVYVGDRTGQIVQWAYGRAEPPRCHRLACGDPVRSMQVAGIGGVDRLILASDVPWVTVRVLRDIFSTQYHAPRPVHRAKVAGDLLVAADSSRSWLYTWRLSEPHQEPARLNVGPDAEGRIQDFAAF